YASVASSENPLVERLADYAKKVKNWRIAPRTSQLADWLAETIQLNGFTRNIVVALDGWDELSSDSDVPAQLPSAAELPQDCYLVLAGRPDLRAAAASAKVRICSDTRLTQEIIISPRSTENLDLLKDYTLKRLKGDNLPKEWVKPLIDLA